MKFHDGSAFNADAVIFSLDRALNDKSPSFDRLGRGVLIASLWPLVAYRKIDDYKVELQTKGIDTLMPSLLNRFLIASPANFEKVGKDWQAYRKSPSGTGPWKMKAWTPREHAELERNTEYWNKDRIPKTERMVVLPIPDASTRTAALLSGRVDWIESPAPEFARQAAGRRLQDRNQRHPAHVALYAQHAAGAPTADIRVRKALNLAVDRDAMVKLLGGLAVPAVGCVPPDHPWFGNPTFKIKYDPAEAKKLLAEAGYGPAKKLKMKVAISTSGSGQMYPLIMNEFIQQQFAEVGVELDFQVMDWNALINLARRAPSRRRASSTTPSTRATTRWTRTTPSCASSTASRSRPRARTGATSTIPSSTSSPGRGAQHGRSGGTRQSAGQDRHQDGRRRRVRLVRPRRLAKRHLVQGQGLRPPQELVCRFSPVTVG